MTQDQTTGAAAAKFGREAAAAIAERIGARKISRVSNEFEYNGNRVTIRTARQGNANVGVLYAMLDRVDAVIAAFEIAVGEFELRSLSPKQYKAAMRDSATGKGRVGLVHRKTFVDQGTFVTHVNLNGKLAAQ